MPAGYNLGSKYIPWFERPAYTGSVVRASTFRYMSQQVQRLYLHHYRSKRTFFYPSPATAPRASIAAIDTNYDFEMVDGTYDPPFEIPWFRQTNFDRIYAKVTVGVTNFKEGLSLRITNSTLVDTVASSQGEYTEISVVSSPGPGGWAYSYDPSYRIATVNLNIFSPVRGATSRTAIGLQARYTNLEEPLSDATTTFSVRVVSIQLWDGFAPEDTE